MRWRFVLVACSPVTAAALGALVYAQLGDTQTASGTVNVASTSADLDIDLECGHSSPGAGLWIGYG